jgi:hypothetical protein
MTKKQERSIETVLQMDGIMAKGYGMVAKFPMRDTALKMKDKAIYAYLCALSGGGVKTWPSRSKILADLQIGKSAFYNSMERLLKEGYLTKTDRRIHGENGMWTKTIYTIELNPKRYQESSGASQPTDADSNTLSVQGMLNDGWGFAPRLVMQDPRLSVKEKALYAYILTYAAAGRVAYPDVSTITYHLGISQETYRSLVKQLCTLGYIIRHRKRKANGQLGGYDYYIPPNPVTISSDSSTPMKQDTVKQNTVNMTSEVTTSMKQNTVNAASAPSTPMKQDTVEQNTMNVASVPTTPMKRDTVEPDTANPPTAKPPTANRFVRKIQNTSNTSLSITREVKYNPSTTTSTSVEKSVEIQNIPKGGLDTAMLMKKIFDCSGIPMDILSNSNQVTDVLRYLCGTDWTKGEVRYWDEEKQEAFVVVMKAMLRLCTQKCSKISSLVLTREQIVEKLNLCIEKDSNGVYMADFIEFATSDYLEAVQSRRDEGKTPVRNPVNYACAVIWSAIDSYRRMKWLEIQENDLFY